jgi:hypothetical protein
MREAGFFVERDYRDHERVRSVVRYDPNANTFYP